MKANSQAPLLDTHKKARGIMMPKGADWKKAWDSVMKMVTKYVEQGPFFLNPDEVVVKNVISGLAKNIMEYGYAYCPCRQVEGVPEKDRENICPCRTHKEDIARRGICECGLFVSQTYLNKRRKINRTEEENHMQDCRGHGKVKVKETHQDQQHGGSQ